MRLIAYYRQTDPSMMRRVAAPLSTLSQRGHLPTQCHTEPAADGDGELQRDPPPELGGPSLTSARTGILRLRSFGCRFAFRLARTIYPLPMPGSDCPDRDNGDAGKALTVPVSPSSLDGAFRMAFSRQRLSAHPFP
jgi:hypothetical protein